MERNLMMAQTLDGATLDRHSNYTLGGLKYNDQSNPMTSSRNDAIPLLCVIGGETKRNVRRIFSVLFSEIAEAATVLIPRLLGVLALMIVTNCDMSCEWKLCGYGGAAKNSKYPLPQTQQTDTSCPTISCGMSLLYKTVPIIPSNNDTFNPNMYPAISKGIPICIALLLISLSIMMIY